MLSQVRFFGVYYVDAHHSLPYGVVVNVMVQLQNAKVVKLGLVTQPPMVEVK